MLRENLQTFSKAMLVPLSIIAFGSMLLGVGGAMTSKITIESFSIDWMVYSRSNVFKSFNLLKILGEMIFKNISIFYTIGIALSLARKEQGIAAFSALVAYLAMQTTISTLLNESGYTLETTTIEEYINKGHSLNKAIEYNSLYTSDLGYFTYRTGILGSVILGIIISYTHRKIIDIKMPFILSFFSGVRIVPIVSLILGGIIGLLFFFMWPNIGNLLFNLTKYIQKIGLLGTFLYRIICEFLIPFGLHSLVTVPIRWSEIGGRMYVDGKLIVGTSGIQLAQLASPGSEKLLVRSFMGGMAIINFASIPGISLAIYETAKEENKKKMKAILISGVLSSVLFGVTEPLIFIYIYAAPAMYFLIHLPLAGIAEVLCEYFKVSIYQGNLKDWIPFLLRIDKLNIYPFFYLMPIFFIIYYKLFKYFILRYDIKVLGREIEESLKKEEDKNELENKIINNLGGVGNILELDHCISRLRVVVSDISLVSNEKIWKNELKAIGIVKSKNGVQIIYGVRAAELSIKLRNILKY